jgi:hypothetical protein
MKDLLYDSRIGATAALEIIDCNEILPIALSHIMGQLEKQTQLLNVVIDNSMNIEK